jgi:hypothetical protein
MANAPAPLITVSQKLSLFPPPDQQGIPVALDEWHRIMNRIKQCTAPGSRLEAFGWAAIGAAISFLAVALSLPFGVEWSKSDGKVERINWAPCIIESTSGFLTLLFAICGILALTVPLPGGASCLQSLEEAVRYRFSCFSLFAKKRRR